jgi:hypothetical protein
MATFKLGSGAGEFELGIDGSASKAGTPVGNWRTTPDNKIQVKTEDGAASVFDVGWKFNADNQLVLLDGAREIFNFQADRTVTPGFELRKAVLRFTPSRTSGFSFELRGEWNLTDTHDLEFEVGGRTSRLKGFINDAEKKNRFLYLFKDNKRPTLLHRLQFEGQWETPASEAADLLFRYAREDGTEDVFELPGTVVIDKTTNQLRYEYTKNGKKTFDFEGTLVISPDFQITYVIGRTETATGDTVVDSSVLRIGASFAKTDFSGNLELAVMSAGGARTLTIRGTFAAVLAGSAQLAVGFTFEQVRTSGAVTSTTFAFAGELKIKNNAVVQWAFSTTNTTTRTVDLSVGTDIKLQNGAAIDARLNLTTAGGAVKSVTFLLGVSF